MIQSGATAATIDSPIEHLIACHRRIEQRLDMLISAASHILTNRTAVLDAIGKSLTFPDTSGALHTEDEEASLFPRLRQKLSSAEITFIDSLEAQHVEAGAIYSELKRLALALEVSGALPSGLLAVNGPCFATISSRRTRSSQQSRGAPLMCLRSLRSLARCASGELVLRKFQWSDRAPALWRNAWRTRVPGHVDQPTRGSHKLL